MMLNIDSDDLDLLLERKREFIGVHCNWFDILNAISLIFSAYYINVDKQDYIGLIIKVSFFFLGLVNLVGVGIAAYKKKKNNYTMEMLKKDIEDLDMKERNSSIIAITNPSNPRKYLVYYDLGWEFLAFPNYGTRNNKNEDYIRDKLSRDFSVPVSNISVTLTGHGNEEKYSTPNGEIRAYKYSFYKGTITGIEEVNFNVDGRKYRWMTAQEMLEEPGTKANNSYVVNRVNEYC